MGGCRVGADLAFVRNWWHYNIIFMDTDEISLG
jgi:hypothetical protein